MTCENSRNISTGPAYVESTVHVRTIEKRRILQFWNVQAFPWHFPVDKARCSCVLYTLRAFFFSQRDAIVSFRSIREA